MPEKKKQHYVPKFYLRGFANDDKKFYLYNINKNQMIGAVPFETQCFEDYFYGADKKWENQLAKFEAQWNQALEHVKARLFSDEDIQKIKEFAMYQRIRTKKSLEKETASTQKTIEKLLKAYAAHESYNPDGLNKAIEVASRKKAEEAITPKFLLEMMQKQSELINDLAFLLVNFKTQTKLLSSDNPVIIMNPYIKTAGLAMIGLIVLLPISPEDLVVLYDRKIYGNKIENAESKTVTVNYYAQKINSLTFANANEIIFSKHDINDDCFANNFKKIRKENETKESVSTFGPVKNQIVAMQNAGLDGPSSLPF